MELEQVLSRITIQIIGSAEFDDEYFSPLLGVAQDIEKILSILVSHPAALYSSIQPQILLNPTSSEVRNSLTEYVYSRSAENDILLLYYSGHGAIVNGNKFGFVCKDTKVYTKNDQIIPSTVITSDEVFSTLSISKSMPILIVDACHSGLIRSTSLKNPIWGVTENMREDIHSRFASNFVLFTACAEDEVTPETSLGGFFSRKMYDVCDQGDETQARKPLLTIADIHEMIVSRGNIDLLLGVEPRLFFGYGAADIPLVRNIAYQPLIVRLENYQLKILEFLWNDGHPITISREKLDEELGKGAYANYSKLTYGPWQLVSKEGGIIRLTEKGVFFMSNEIPIPEQIIKDSTTGDVYIPDPDVKVKTYDQFRPQPPLFKV